MIFPIGDDQVKGGATPIFSYTFLAINVLVFLYQVSLSPAQLDQFIYTYATIPRDILSGRNLFTLITSMFLHGGWMHLIGNMLFLWVFADNIEATIGNVRFVIFYILGGVCASLAHVYLSYGSTVPSLGASGAISAVLGAYLVMFPRSRVKVLFFLFIIIKQFFLPAFMFLGVWIAMQLFSGFQNLGPEASAQGGTAWWAHIGGFIFGVVIGLFLRRYIYPPSHSYT